MKAISHRGNINSIEKDRENSPDYINEALKNGFDVEVDVRFENGKFFLGHDFNQFEIDKKFLLNNYHIIKIMLLDQPLSKYY